MRVAVLGANGFVGRHVVPVLSSEGARVRVVLRPTAHPVPVQGEVHRLGDGGWRAAVAGCDVVVHLIARTHRLDEVRSAAVEDDYRRVNVETLQHVVAAAQQEGVRRLVYVSSIKALGESRPAPYREDDEPRPQDAYGRTKLEAEQVLAAAAGLEAVVLRPPLVYGPGAPGNVARLLRVLSRGLPLPLGSAHAQRSLIFADNLADVIGLAVHAPAAAGRTYLVADREVLTVRELTEGLAAGLGGRARLLPAPLPALRMAGRLTGRREEVARLTEPLVLDTARVSGELGWQPPVRALEGLHRTARAFLEAR